MAIAEFVLSRKVTTLDEALRLLSESGRPVLLETIIEGEPAKGVLINYEDYQKLLQRLEDLEDLQAMYEAEAEYRAGEGRPFSEIVAELEAEESADVQS
ncbi:MAG: hypothetical protein DRI61_14700 [Chloroflexi bacterium]|nr:MAG: hypothetical protein DRI61_14700 [Chloroflexota bacterium]HDN80255.1 hypothetical protein [Chloroflexota bacterium]